MLTADRLCCGQGISWTSSDGTDMYGAIVVKKDGSIRVAPVSPLKSGDKCYNDVGIVKGDANYLVRMKDCPPPFSDVCQDSALGQCYVLANPKCAIGFSDKQLSASHAALVDDGKRLSKRDFQAIFDCAKHGTPEKQLSGPVSSETEKKPAPPVGPKTVQAEAAPAAPKPPSKTLKQGFSDVQTAVEAHIGKSQPKQAKPKSWEADRPLGRLADLAENLGMMEDDGPDFGP